MITPELKDSVLNWLCENLAPERLERFIPSVISISFDELNAILIQFERHGYIVELNARRSVIYLILTVDAIDFYRLGGFVMRDIVAAQTIEKLSLEVKQLQQSFPEKAETFTTILANLVTIASIFLPK